MQSVLPFRSGFNSELVHFYSSLERCAPRHSWGPGVRDNYLIHYIVEGQGVFEMDGHTYPLQQGDAFFIPPGVIMRYEADGAQPWFYIWEEFLGMGADDLLQRAGISRAHPVFHCADDRIRDCLFQMAGDTGKTGHDTADSARDVRLTGLLYSLFALLIENNQLSAMPDEDSGKELYFKKAVEYISMNYTRTITVASIAAYIGIDRKYLHVLFKQFSGVSPQQYLLNFRMQRACELMASEKLRVEYVAHSVGYSDAFLFSKMFKKQVGLPPADYMKKQSDSVSRRKTDE